MNDKGYTIEEILSIFDQAPASLECFKGLGRLTPEKKKLYQEKYEHFLLTNNSRKLNGKNEEDDNRIKGEALEDLVAAMFEATGEYFEIYRNIRNGTNEVDLFVQFSGKAKRISHILGERYSDIICECKNYGTHVKVTYVGKFYSLMQSTNNKIGIMFSHAGFSGKSWSAATGLSKKLFMLKEKEEDKTYILDFSKDDFKAILDGESLFNILNNKCQALRLGIDEIKKYITLHPNENKVVN